MYIGGINVIKFLCFFSPVNLSFIKANLSQPRTQKGKGKITFAPHTGIEWGNKDAPLITYSWRQWNKKFR